MNALDSAAKAARLFSLLLVSSALKALPEDAPIVRTENGLVSGQTLNVSGRQVDAFYGIPYAEPPVEGRRFRKPVPVGSWNGTFMATTKPPPCAQTNHFHTDNLTLYYEVNSEDCLYLNVWRPTAACNGTVSCKASLPVVIFIHGGAFQWGDSAIFLHDGANFVALSNVVFVSFNYRLNVFGFLSAGTKDFPGNSGLWDQNVVLKWVQRNIRFFGGDPNQVTLLGQSAGALSAAIHTISPHSEGLFKRIVMLSGSPMNTVFTIAAKGVDSVMSLAQHVGCASWKSADLAEVTDCLRRVDKEEFLRLVNGVDPRKTIYAPVSGDEYLPNDCSYVSTWRNKIRSTEVMVGTMEDEGSLFMYNAFHLAPNIRSYVDIDHRTTCTLILSALLKVSSSQAKEVTKVYFPDDHDDNNADITEVLSVLKEAVGDGLFVCASNFFAEVAADQGLPVYRYVFAHRPSYSFWPASFGASHGDDVPYVLGSLPFFKDPSRYTDAVLPERATYEAVEYTEQEERFMRAMVASIAAFAKTGTPTVPLSNASWPRYTSARPEFVNLEVNGHTTGLGPRREVCDVWRRYLIKRDPAEQKNITQAEVTNEEDEEEEEEEEEETEVEEQEEEEEEEVVSENAIAQETPVETPKPSPAALQPERTLNRTGSGVPKSADGCLQLSLLFVLSIAAVIVGRPVL